MKRIVVIEDETVLLRDIVEMLELEGFFAVGAEDGEAGFQLAQEQIPDLIVCDITMPGIDGYEVLSRLRSHPPTASIPFIFLTARADRPFMRHGMELGADDYLTKPFSMNELRAAIEARLEHHQSIMQESAHNLDQAKQVLIRLVSHELRTPLVSIATVTDIVSRQITQLSPGQLQDLLDSLARGAQRLNRLVEQIVLIVQFEARMLNDDSLREHGLPIQVSELLIAAIDMARRFAYRQPDVSIRLDNRDLDATIWGDVRALRHALAEVIANALVFSPERDSVSVAQWQADQHAWISIVDRGPGMTPENLALAQQAFRQIDREQQEQQGMGLGLPLAKQIVETHGGTLKIISVVGKGTQVTIGFPALPSQDKTGPHYR